MGGSASVKKRPPAKPPSNPKEDTTKTLEDHLKALEKAIGFLEECKDFKTKECSSHLSAIKCASSPAGLKRVDSWNIIDIVVKLNYASIFGVIWADLHSVDLSQGHGKNKDGTPSVPHRALANLKSFKGAWWNLSDWGDVRLVEALGDAGAIPLLIGDLEEPDLALDNLTSDSRRHLIKGSLGTLHNMVRHSHRMRKELRKIPNSVQLLTEYSSCKVLIIQAKCFLILSYILCEHEYDTLKAKDNAIGFLVGMLRESLNYKSHKTKRYGFSSSEILQGLCQMALNDQNKVKLMDNGCVPLMVRMLEKNCSNEENLLASEALWKLAFVEENRARMKGNMDLIEGLISHMKSEDPKLREQCRGALWEIMEGELNLEVDITSIEDLQMEAGKGRRAAPVGKKLHVMISYQWDVQQRMLALRDMLKAEGCTVWMDIDELDGDILGGMADAVENSAVILVCFSEKYKESQSCRTEATYAYKQSKPIVPLMVEPNYNPNGWLGALIGTLKYYKFTDGNIDNAEFMELMATIKLQMSNKDTVKPQKESHTASSAPAGNSATSKTPASLIPPAASISTLSTWSMDHVQEWLSENGLGALSTKFDGVDGELLYEMYRQLQRAPEYFHNSVSSELGLSYFQVLKFTRVLEKSL